MAALCGRNESIPKGEIGMITRRAAGQLIVAAAATAAIGGAGQARAADQVLKIGVNLSLTGADAESATRILHGAQLAFDDANAANAVPGYTFQVVSFDDGTATAGQYDPAQAATNARKMVSDKQIIAAIGPQMSGAGKAMSPILSEGDLAIITPVVHQPGHHQPEICRAVPSGRQGDLFPHGHHGRIPGPEHGQLHGRYPAHQVGLCAGR